LRKKGGKCSNGALLAAYSVISPSSVSLNSAVSLKVSSMILRLPPVSFGLMFSITILPLSLPRLLLF